MLKLCNTRTLALPSGMSGVRTRLVHEVLFGLLLTTTSTCGRGLGVNNGSLGVSSGGLDFVSGGLDFVNGSLARWRRLNKLYCVVFLAGGVGLKDEETEGAEVDGEGDE
ncbi:hypothetical protein F2Q69_00003533, partial [Brassica cretica]